MIKINLLNSVTERQVGAIVSVDRKVGSPATRFALMSIAVAFLIVAVIGWDVVSTRMAKADAERQLAEQQQIAEELKAVMAEQKELEQKIQNIDLRIEAIKKLRNAQAAPTQVLEAFRERVGMVPGLFLESVEMKDSQLEFKGYSTNEDQVAQFGRSLEFSEGLFSNLHIETKREDLTVQNASVRTGGDAPKVQVVNFTIKCAYTGSKSPDADNAKPTTASVTGAPQAAAPIQVAKN